MSSIVNRPNGRKWVCFSWAKKRHTIRLGAVGKSAAEEFQRRLDRLIDTRRLGLQPDPELRAWLSALSGQHHGNLSTAGLIDARGALTLGDLEAAFLDHLRAEQVKPRTIANVKVVLRNLTEHFGSTQQLDQIDTAAVAQWRVDMMEGGRVDGGPLERTTVSRRTRRARQVFEFASSRGWITENPFASQKKWNEVNTSRDHYVPSLDVQKLIAQSSDLEFRCLLAVTRYLGIRCPSEVHPLTWDCLNQKEGTLRVYSPKTAHHPGKDWRTVPVFEEVGRELQKLHRERIVGQTVLFPNSQVSGAALSGKLKRLCNAAGIPCWPKPWVNMRASAERDMLLNHPIDDVASWLGHSPQTALRHYNRVAKDHRTRSAGKALRLYQGSRDPK